MDIYALSEKAEFIANKRQCLLKQGRQYCNTLTQGIVLSKAKLYQIISFSPDDGLRFCLFDHFVIHICLSNVFNSHTIEYFLEELDESNKILITSANIDEKGLIDEIIDNRNREQVLKHYLSLLHLVYDGLYQAINENTPVSLSLFQQPAIV
ncbi:TPA: transcriptional regulator [Raoultella planticola]|nr:transcriptional regulator [Raoultella planticola]